MLMVFTLMTTSIPTQLEQIFLMTTLTMTIKCLVASYPGMTGEGKKCQ